MRVAVIFVFVDGVGAGLLDPDRNPLVGVELLLLRFADGTSGAPLPAGGRAVLADACLGVPGRPQSATGQTAIFTGENAPAHVGHVLGFPNAPLRELLRARSLFRALAAAGRSAVFANAYPIAYLRASARGGG